MLNRRFARRLAFSALFALLLGLSWSMPSTAIAAGVSGTAGYSKQLAMVDEVVTFTFTLTTNATTEVPLTFTFPDDATIVDATVDGCAGALTINGSVVDGGFATEPGECSVNVRLSYAQPGQYTNSDHAFAVQYTDGENTLPLTDLTVDAAITIVAPVTAPPVCRLTPDLAVSPQFIDIAPNGTATVELAMRNLCPDAVTARGDLLVSFSDGLTVVDHSEGLLNLGQRAALQDFSLAADETRRWTVTVKAAGTLSAAPVHVTEHYVGGRVMSRVDGVFITPPPAAVAAPEPAVVAPAPVVAAPVPAVLPNTSAAAGGLLPQMLMAAVAAVAIGVARRRR
jgi:hypothetical protein